MGHHNSQLFSKGPEIASLFSIPREIEIDPDSRHQVNVQFMFNPARAAEEDASFESSDNDVDPEEAISATQLRARHQSESLRWWEYKRAK